MGSASVNEATVSVPVDSPSTASAGARTCVIVSGASATAVVPLSVVVLPPSSLIVTVMG